MLKASAVHMSSIMFIAAIAIFYSCSSPNTTTVSSESVRIVICPTSTVTFVSIANFLFQPNSVSIAVNDIVKWTNNDTTTDHTVTSGTPGALDGKFDSGNLAPNATVCMQFMAAGLYQYFCNIHPNMTGVVTVQ